MLKKLFEFDEQLKIGNQGEADFQLIYKELSPAKSVDDRRFDFKLNNNKTIELKTDSYDMSKTPNFFMERFTDLENKRINGGPWRTKEHLVDYFVYYFLKNKTYFWFDPKTLCEFLDKYILDNTLHSITIPNKDKRGGRYEALGYKIPRDITNSVLLKEHKIS